MLRAPPSELPPWCYELQTVAPRQVTSGRPPKGSIQKTEGVRIKSKIQSRGASGVVKSPLRGLRGHVKICTK